MWLDVNGEKRQRGTTRTMIFGCAFLVSYISRFALPVYQPRTFISTSYQGTLGWGFATALGVKVANPDKPVLSINGDGGVLFTLQELATAVQHGISTVTLIFNDNAYGNVRRAQKSSWWTEEVTIELIRSLGPFVISSSFRHEGGLRR